jgi:hypothetical protein
VHGIIQNNIIGRIRGYIGESLLISNNLFLDFGYGHNSPSSYWLKGIYFNNNIFYGFSNFNNDDPVESCVFMNNVTFGDSDAVLLSPSINNTGENNLININPQFEDASTIIFNFSYNYRLKDSSPAKNNGTDGTDIGITGGGYPWATNDDGTLDLSGKPNIPQIEKMNILNSVVPLDGTLKVSVKVKSQN